jgi:ABC transporter substrate binding protein (PQQ-dependent alcohol dehydrogenase system)
MTDWRHVLAAGLLALAALPLAAAPLVIGVVQRADDERLAPARLALAYPGHPGGPLQQGVELAIADARLALAGAQRSARIEAIELRESEAPQAALQRLSQAGAVALIADLPTLQMKSLAAATALPVFNAGAADDALREVDCRPNLWHTLPSERMRADALAQWLVARRWQRVLLLHGPSVADAERRATAQASLQRHGLKVVAVRPFKLSADPRDRALANPLLLTGGVEHDVVWVVDSDGEFARGLPYRTALPRPVVGDAGLLALAWAPHHERNGAPQLARRFERLAGRPMTTTDWAAWAAAKAIIQVALDRTPAGAPGFGLDGFKGPRLSFRLWDRQLRQPLLLTDGQGVVGIAPLDGVLHPRDVLDTLGADEAERRCPASAATAAPASRGLP